MVLTEINELDKSSEKRPEMEEVNRGSLAEARQTEPYHDPLGRDGDGRGDGLPLLGVGVVVVMEQRLQMLQLICAETPRITRTLTPPNPIIKVSMKSRKFTPSTKVISRSNLTSSTAESFWS